MTIGRVWVWSLIFAVLVGVLTAAPPSAAPDFSAAAAHAGTGVTITDFTPRRGGPGTWVTIRGTNFAHVAAVTFNGTRAKRYTVRSRTRIIAAVPALAQSGPIGVTTPSGSAITRARFTAAITFKVYVGYYDTHHHNNPQPKPDPWQGSPNTLFVGQPDSSSGGWDTSAIRIDNLSDLPLVKVVVTVDIGPRHFVLWGTHTIPARQSMILAQMGYPTFDGSDLNSAGCYNCDPGLCTDEVSTIVPVIHLTINGETMNLPDTDRVLNTQGVDAAGCPPTGAKNLRNDESQPWRPMR